MDLNLYEQVALTRDIPKHKLKAGDIATLVELTQPVDGERGCVLEVFNALGDTLAVVTVPEGAIEPLRADEVLTVRTLAQAS